MMMNKQNWTLQWYTGEKIHTIMFPQKLEYTERNISSSIEQ